MDSTIYFIIGLAAGAVGAVSSGGGLLSIPLLMFMGISPIHAIATTRWGSFFGAASSLYYYSKRNRISWKYVFPYLAFFSILAGLSGPRILPKIDEAIVATLIGIVLIFLSAFLLATNKHGLATFNRRKRYKVLGGLLVLPAMFYAVMFGAGGGALVIIIMILFFGLNIKNATATGMSIWIIGTGVAALTYLITGLVDYGVAVPLVFGSLIGGYIGASYIEKIDRSYVKIILGIIVGLSGVKILFF